MPNSTIKRYSVNHIIQKKGQEPLVCLSAYTYPVAQIIDDYCDIILVGDSLGMAIYGLKDTLQVSVEMMINHGRAVVAATNKALVVIDLPFGSYESCPKQAFATASRIISQTGAAAVKLESKAVMAPTVKFLIERGIPVMGHVGLLPQHVNILGGYKIQGRDQAVAAQIKEDALKIQEAGAFALVIEGVTEKLASEISKSLSIPTIGIGASVSCDGQILVVNDLLGLVCDFQPKFVKNYANLAAQIKEAVQNYAKEVKERNFPGKGHVY